MKNPYLNSSINMTEPASTTALGYFAAKFGAALGAGILGALVMSSFDLPKTRMQLAVQASVAGVCADVFTAVVVRWADKTFDFIDLSNADLERMLEVVLPVGFLIGALSWGFVGALVALRRIIGERAGEKAASAVGLGDAK
jgi:hypothetical protein